jgi:hypothetical protein
MNILAAVRFCGWYSHLRSRVVFSPDNCQIITQEEFAQKLALYRVTP